MDEIKKLYPKSVEVFGNWLISQLFGGLDTVEDLDTEELENSKNQVVEAILESSPRTTFDFFDHYGLFISIIDRGGGDIEYSISGTEVVRITESRLKAEKGAINEAFKALEERL